MLFSPHSLPPGPNIKTKKALLLLDFQNDFCSPLGRLGVPNTTNFVPKLPPLIAKFREQGHILWAQTSFRQPCSSVSPRTGSYCVLSKTLVAHLRQQPRHSESTIGDNQEDKEPSQNLTPKIDDDVEAFLSNQIPESQRCCLPNTFGSDIVAPLDACVEYGKDLVFSKSSYSVFADFSFSIYLRSRTINDLYICGSLSNVGVYATVLDAVQQGFNITLVEDCLGYRDEECHLEAMRRMADDLGANGIDYQELMDDLHGLLGDVIPETQYTRSFQLSQGLSRGQLSHSQKVNTWIDSFKKDRENQSFNAGFNVDRNDSVGADTGNVLADAAQPAGGESPGESDNARESPTYSPSRKRSISDRDELEGVSPARSTVSHQSGQLQPGQLQSSERASEEALFAKKSKLRSLVKEDSQSISSRAFASKEASPPPPLGQTLSASHIERPKGPLLTSQPGDRSMSEPVSVPVQQSNLETPKTKRRRQKYDPTFYEQDDVIGDGDTKIIRNILGQEEADQAFSKLKNQVAWQKMYHRTGEVPRLVAVQGSVFSDGSIPIYRHPADESPPLLPFDDTVDQLRQSCERLVNHKLNHVLIQYYRHGEDNISEHSDKTLDIVRDSSIVNLSLGAMRTMTLRKKKGHSARTDNAQQRSQGNHRDPPRTTQRVRLSHNSLFVLGERTNASWLHSIRADKRLKCEKSEEELAFGEQRISLTFRNIGTFIDPEKQLIWGQGATRKTRDDAQKILWSHEAEVVGEQMIIGFGKENQLNDTAFDWNEVYGGGFDVVNFEFKELGT